MSARTRYALFVEEHASEEDGGHLINREVLMVADCRAEVEAHLNPEDDLRNELTSRIRFWIQPILTDGDARRVGA